VASIALACWHRTRCPGLHGRRLTAAAGKASRSRRRPFAATRRTLFHRSFACGSDDDNPATAGGPRMSPRSGSSVGDDLYATSSTRLQWKSGSTHATRLKDAWLVVSCTRAPIRSASRSAAEDAVWPRVDGVLPGRRLRRSGPADRVWRLRARSRTARAHLAAAALERRLFNTDAAAASLLGQAGRSTPNDVDSRADGAARSARTSAWDYARATSSIPRVALWTSEAGCRSEGIQRHPPGRCPTWTRRPDNVNGRSKHRTCTCSRGVPAPCAEARNLRRDRSPLGAAMCSDRGPRSTPRGASACRYASLALSSTARLLTGRRSHCPRPTRRDPRSRSQVPPRHALKTQAAWTLQRVAPTDLRRAQQRVRAAVTILF
jgi:hypothetical protein